MKLDQLLFAACAGVVALATGCTAPASQPAKTASATDGDRVSDAVAITQLMSAQLPGPAPKVGKPHLAGDDDATLGIDAESSVTDSRIDSSASDGESAPKSVRRSDGSRRHGGFGTTK